MTKVILKENIIGLGRAGDVKEVKDGYARNFLIPKKYAEYATKGKEEHLKRLSAALAKKAQKIFEDAQALKSDIEQNTLEFVSKAGDEGKLFGSVTNADISDKLKEIGYDIEKKKIVTDHIKTLGKHKVDLKLDEGVTAEIEVVVISEDEKKEREATESESEA